MKSSEPIISVRHRKVPNCRPYSVVNEMATRSMRIPRVFPNLAYSLYSLHDTKKGIEKKIPADPNSRYIIQKFNLTLLLDRQPRREYINIRRNTHGEFHCLLLLRYFVYCRQLNHIKVSEAQLRKKAFYNIRKFFFSLQ